ncbi:SH3 domain-containing protein [Salipiger sp. P9]|uniref:SH3 domain-containing protein n=1 Tax=Salipiger pentaromativorans TaxID=2943193 RepID=UPI0021574267|nr:SH3 domain-containing protein [Salipiger pentaromativorans]MCR8549369.1 SH3 domain-containing protein [Salipiger pentaromativorans]
MTRFILLTFGFLGWAWYEMSGGAGFEAGTPLEPVASLEEDRLPEVARAETGAADLTSVAQTRAKPAIAPVPKLDITLVAAKPVELPSAAPVRAVDVAAAPVVSDAAPVVPALESLPDLRLVTGSRVNMRNGPGTGFSVVSRLVRGDKVEVLADPGQGWVKLKVVETNRIGWMSDDFLRVAVN